MRCQEPELSNFVKFVTATCMIASAILFASSVSSCTTLGKLIGIDYGCKDFAELARSVAVQEGEDPKEAERVAMELCQEAQTNPEFVKIAIQKMRGVQSGGSWRDAIMEAAAEVGIEMPDIAEPTEPEAPDVTPPPVPEGFPTELNTNSRDGDPRKLEETIYAELRISGKYIQILTKDSRKWRTVNTEGGVNANIWVMAERNGKWFATTWEWMRPGSWSKPWNKCRPDHAKSSVMPSNYSIQNGDYIFASTIVRHPRHRNGSERTNLMKVSGL